MVWVREWLENNNIKNENIGFDGEYVTINNVRFYKPEKLENDKVYGNENNLQTALNKYKKSYEYTYNPGDVRVRDYALNYGSKYGFTNNDIGWAPHPADPTLGKVTVGGVAVTDYIRTDSQDRTWAGAKDVQDWVDRWARTNGRLKDDAYVSKYGVGIDGIMNELLSQRFSYNPNTDPLFLNYKNIYEREGTRAYEDTMGKAAGMTGGIPSSYAASVAAQARQNWSDRLTDAVPQFENQAYGRYKDDVSQKERNLSYLKGLESSDYDRYWKEKNYKERYI